MFGASARITENKGWNNLKAHSLTWLMPGSLVGLLLRTPMRSVAWGSSQIGSWITRIDRKNETEMEKRDKG